MEILHYLLLSKLQLLVLAQHISPHFLHLGEKKFMIMMTTQVANTYDCITSNLCDAWIFVTTIFCH